MAAKVLLDMDPGIDDSLALLLALGSPELQVVGITTVSGNVPAELGAKNALRVLELCGRDDVPVFKGSERPLLVPLVTAQDTHGEDGLGETFLPEPQMGFRDGGVDFILSSLYEHPGLTIIAVGPLTNIAAALQRDPQAFDRLGRLVVMGGSAKSHGNCSPVAEYNFWADPHAAAYVFQHLSDIVMVGLDVTRRAVLTPNHRELLRQFGTPTARFIRRITRFYLDYHWRQERTLGCVINDPLAVAVVLAPDLVTARPYYVEVVTDGPARGQAMVDFGRFHRRTPNAHVCLTVDAQRFMRLFLKRVCPEFAADIDAYFEGEAAIPVWI